MSEESVFGSKVKELYRILCREEWNATMAGILVAVFSVMIMAWWRPWGIVGAIRNWGDWMMYGGAQLFGTDWGFFQYFEDAPSSIFDNSGSVIGLGFVAGAFLSANLGNDFAFRFPPVLELCKGMVAGVLMGIGATMSGGCNVGGMYNAIGNLSAAGFAMWLGLTIGVLMGLKYLYWEMEYISWGSGGAKTIDFPFGLKIILAIGTIGVLIWGAYAYAGSDDDYIASLGGMLLISACLGYTMQRGRWCMVQGFREPHMTGDSKMARSVALSIVLVAVGAAVLKYSVPMRIEGEAVLAPINYVRGTFGWGGVVGGLIFGFGAMLAGGCGSGTMWRVGEGQIKLWLVVPFFAVSNSIMTAWFKDNDFEPDGVLGQYIYMPDTFLGYGGTLAVVIGAMVLWYLIVTWNEETNKLILSP
jgi:uncharacterized membrane protein YedE/YeeE